jgi:hypothetical protein
LWRNLKETDHVRSLDFEERVTIEGLQRNSFGGHRLHCSESELGKVTGFLEWVDE